MSTPLPPAPFGGSAVAAQTAHNGEECMTETTTTKSELYLDDNEKSDSPAASEQTRHNEITKLARTFSRLSQQQSSDSSSDAINTFIDPTKNPELDPNSSDFNSRKWVRNTLQLTRDPDRFPRRTAGVSFRNLNVFGYGTAADYQLNFGNVWLKMFDGARRLLGLGQKVRIDILRDFEGIVDHGEMLVVLGRPGRQVSFHLLFAL